MREYFSDDISFCARDCDKTSCQRCHKNIHEHWREHSYSDFYGAEGCIATKKPKLLAGFREFFKDV